MPRKTSTPSAVRRVEVSDPLALAASPYSYADAFRVESAPEPGVAPEAWMRAGFAATPAGVRRLVGLLGMSPTPAGTADRLSVFRIVTSDRDVVLLEAELPIMRVSLIGRSVGSGGRTVTTVLHFRRRTSARLVWLLLAPLHRRAVRTFLTSRPLPGSAWPSRSRPGPGVVGS